MTALRVNMITKLKAPKYNTPDYQYLPVKPFTKMITNVRYFSLSPCRFHLNSRIRFAIFWPEVISLDAFVSDDFIGRTGAHLTRSKRYSQSNSVILLSLHVSQCAKQSNLYTGEYFQKVVPFPTGRDFDDPYILNDFCVCTGIHVLIVSYR